MTWLAAVLHRYSEPAEADLAHYYGIELVDFWRGKITARALSVRLRNLPDGALLWRAQHSAKEWTQEAYLVAHAADAAKVANWQRAGCPGTAPKPLLRPADVHAAAAKDLRNRARAERYLARQQARQQAQTDETEGSEP